MAFARDSYTATEEQTDFTITFPYISQTHVEVFQEGAELTLETDYTIVSETTVRLNTEATAGDIVVITRKSSQSTRLVDYENASTLTEEDLDTDSLQAFYLVQEAIDAVALALGVDANDLWDAQNVRITELATPTADADAATKAYVDERVDDALLETGNLPASTEAEDGDVLAVIAEGSVDWTEPSFALSDNSVDTEHVVNEAITGLKIEDGAVNTEHFTAEAVTAAVIEDAAVTTTELSPSGGSEGQFLKNEEGTTVAWATVSTGDSWTYGAEVSLNTAEIATVELIENLPSTVTDVEILFNAASTDTNSAAAIIRLGDSGGMETDGYICFMGTMANEAVESDSNTNGFALIGEAHWLAAETFSGSMRLKRWQEDEHLWVMDCNIVRDDGAQSSRTTGFITLDSALLDIDITTTTGTPTFDGGEARVRYRG